MNTRIKLSILWLLVILNIIIADILSIIVELVNKNTLDILGEVKTTMGIAAILLNIPVLMIFFSKSLKYKTNRIINIIASLITLLFVIGGGSLLPHYIICVSIEVIILILIIRTAWKWDGNIKGT
ncbi:MAG: DUF6326 family protein [Nonlabens sp.]|uniref:DUF6326 family protein n=1 Tax=Nonlabens sp. TaxID=1888209 RepID=UPI003EF37F61